MDIYYIVNIDSLQRKKPNELNAIKIERKYFQATETKVKAASAIIMNSNCTVDFRESKGIEIAEQRVFE